MLPINKLKRCQRSSIRKRRSKNVVEKRVDVQKCSKYNSFYFVQNFEAKSQFWEVWTTTDQSFEFFENYNKAGRRCVKRSSQTLFEVCSEILKEICFVSHRRCRCCTQNCVQGAAEGRGGGGRESAKQSLTPTLFPGDLTPTGIFTWQANDFFAVSCSVWAQPPLFW